MNTMPNPSLTVSEGDYGRLMALIEDSDTPAAAALEQELARAEIVADDTPAGAVAMHSRVTFSDLDSGAETTVTLVYPREADVDALRISVLSPVGSALIGLPVGGVIDWPLPGGRVRRLRVVAVA